MRREVISSLYKKGDREDITNWRPISLVNCDSKLYTKVLVNKIQPPLEDIIGLKQTVAIKERTIIDNMQLNRDVISYETPTRFRQQ